MNYRHAFHAGNFADVMKHVVLTRILAHLLRKPTPFRYVDTHAGIGIYDLGSDEAARTGEWRDGVGRMEEPFAPEVEALLAPWRSAIAAIRDRYGGDTYPGSPAVAETMIRPIDRAILVEKHPEDHATLAERFKRARNVKVLHLDGWLAMGSVIPPPERRGLVLIDPPFEERGEFARCAHRLIAAQARWSGGVYALWYPIKSSGDTDGLARALEAAITVPTLRLELTVRPPREGRLVGSGLIVVNPPWTLEAEARSILPSLAARLGPGSFRCDAVVSETM